MWSEGCCPPNLQAVDTEVAPPRAISVDLQTLPAIRIGPNVEWRRGTFAATFSGRCAAANQLLVVTRAASTLGAVAVEADGVARH